MGDWVYWRTYVTMQTECFFLLCHITLPFYPPILRAKDSTVILPIL